MALVKHVRFLLLIFFLFSTPLHATYIVFVNPSHKQDPFWNYVTTFVVDTASSLNVRLDVEYAGANRIQQSDLIQTIASRSNKPNAVIFMPYDGSILKSFKALETAKIPFVTLEQVFNRELFPDLGYPMENYNYWLGEYTYDNHKAAFTLTQYLIDRANKTLNHPKELFAVGFGGDFYQSSLKRMNGFTRAIQVSKNVTLNHMLPANWQREKAKHLFKELHKKYKQTHVLLCASDMMALGVSSGAEDLGLAINQQVFIGGFDWMPEALAAIENNTLTASMGGHFIEASIALIDLYDHLHGIDLFIKGDRQAKVPMAIIHQDNLKQYLPLFSQQASKTISFKQFSRHWSKTTGQQYIPLTIESFALAVIEAANKK